MGEGIPDNPPIGLTAKFYEGLRKRPPRHTSSTYRALVIVGYIAASLEFIALSLMYCEDADFVPALEGFFAGSVFGFAILASDVTFLRGWPRLEALVFVAAVILVSSWMEFYVRSTLDTREGGLILMGFLMGLTLISAVLGNLYLGYRRGIERGMAGPVKVMSDEERRARKAAKAILAAEKQKAGALPRLVFCAALSIGTSAGIMIYSAMGMIADPEGNDMHTAQDWLGMIVWLIPMCTAVVVLIIGLLRMEARIMMFSGVLAGFSFLGVFAVVGQLFLWVAHSRYGLPWKEAGAYWAGDERPSTPAAEDAHVRRALEQLREEQRVEEVRRFRRKMARNAEWMGVDLIVDESRPTTYAQELELAERDLETVEEALDGLVSRNPRRYGRHLKETEHLLDAVRSAQVEEEIRLGRTTESDFTRSGPA